MSRQALIVAFDNSDKNFFRQHPDRLAHIRLPYRDVCGKSFYLDYDEMR